MDCCYDGDSIVSLVGRPHSGVVLCAPGNCRGCRLLRSIGILLLPSDYHWRPVKIRLWSNPRRYFVGNERYFYRLIGCLYWDYCHQLWMRRCLPCLGWVTLGSTQCITCSVTSINPKLGVVMSAGDQACYCKHLLYVLL